MNGILTCKNRSLPPVVPLFFHKTASKLFAILFVLATFLFSHNEAHAAITVAQVSQAAATTASTTRIVPSFTPVANTLYLMWTIQTIGAAPTTVPTATCANGLTMVQVNTVTFATIATPLKRLTLFRAMKPAGLVAGTCTITWGQTTTGDGYSLVSFTGADASGTDGSGAVAQSVTGRTDNATAAAGLSITLAALQAGSTTAGGFSNAVNNANSLTAGTGYTAGTGAAFTTPPTSLRAEWNTTGSTTVNMTQSAMSHIGGIAVEVKPLTTTLATGADPAAGIIIAPGAAATDVDLFTLQTSSGTEAVTSVTVNLSTNSGIGLLAITDNAGTVLGSTATPAIGSNTITVAGMSATTALTTFKVRVTPLSHVLMPFPPGAAYAITAPVTAWAGPNTHAGSDTNPNALTIDNLSPLGATATSGTAGSDSVTLGWTTSVSTDFNTTSGSVLYRWTTTAGAEVPAEGSAPTVNSTNGAATVACVLSSAASFALSGIIDGTGGSAGCNTTALIAGTAYVYKIFQKDVNGNYDTGVTIGTFTTNNPVPTTTSISPTSQTLGALGFTLTVNGTNFVSSSVVRFNGLDRTTTYVSATQLTATIPASDLIAVGAFPITVFNPTPGGGTSNAQTFTVTPAPPTATTNAATGVTAWAATLNGTVSSNGASTAVSFDYGLTAAYGSSIVATQSPLGAGAVNTAVSAALAGLNCNTTFHYRVVATNSAGTTNGLDGTFITGACGAPYPATACAATRFGNDLGCTANDVSISSIALAPTTTRTSCVSGTPVILDLDLTVNFASPDRWDVGIFIANDGKLPTLLPVNGGASSCSVDILPITAPPFGYTFPDLDGVPQGTLDTCGDGNSAINGGLGWGVKRMTSVTLPCYASPTSGGQLFVPFVVSWDNQKSPTGSLCTSNLYPVPNTTSKCNAPASSVSVAVVVLPVITKTNGGTEINPGANTTYTVVINNNSGGTLQASFFKDPAVANLTVNSLSCAAAGGATCPIANNTVADMQGATGIPIPSANLPNNSSLTFTINATLSSGATVGSHLINTASVSIGSNSNSATDDDLIVNAPSAAKSFAPGTITEGGASVLTITLTNPTSTAVTGVSFTDTYPAGLVNTAAASGATTCGGTVTAANGGSSVALSGGTIPVNGSCTVTVNVTSATAGSYTNSTGTVTASVTIPAASATLTVNPAVYGGFNACDSAAVPNAACTNTTTPTTSHITTRIAGSPFNLDIVALKTDGTRQTTYNNNVVVDLLDASNNSGALDAYNCRSSWTAIIATLTTTGFGANGLLTAGPFTVPEAYRDVRVRVTNSGGTTKIGCSTDNFAIRPNSLVVSATDTDWQTAGTARVLNNTSVTGPGCSAVNTPIGCTGTIHKAGQSSPTVVQPFTISATAYNAAGTPAITSNYAGSPGTATLAVCVGTACTASFGTGVALGTWAADPGPGANGKVKTNTAIYPEVGAFNLALEDRNFAAVDSADTAADCTVSGYYVCSAAVAVGRFVPDHFDVTYNTPTFMPAIVNGTAPDSFTYIGQPFSLGTAPIMTITAKNAATNPTTNYTGTLWHLTSSFITSQTWADASATPCATCLPVIVNGGTALTAPTPVNAGSGTGTVTFAVGSGLNYTRPATPVTPFNSALTLSGNLGVDTDNVAPSVATYQFASVGFTDNNPATTNDAQMRYGQIKMNNAYGSELLPLTMTATVQYYNGTTWVLSSTDILTSFNSALSPTGNVLAAIVSGLGGGVAVSSPSVAAVVAGIRTFRLAAPGVRGSADITINAPTYLPSIAGRATFGVYKGRNEFIYLRENY